MSDKYHWLKQFYQDLIQHQTRYSRRLPAICYARKTRWTERDPDIIEKPITPDVNLHRKRDFWKYGYYKDINYVNKFKSDNDNVDECINYRNTSIIIDNEFLEEHGENDYRVILLDGFTDYLMNYFPKYMEDHNSYTQVMICSCLVFVKSDGSYFYAVPFYQNINSPVFDSVLGEYNDSLDRLPKNSEMSKNNLGQDVYFNTLMNDLPVIKTTVEQVQNILTAVPLKRIYVATYQGSVFKDDHQQPYLTYENMGDILPIHQDYESNSRYYVLTRSYIYTMRHEYQGQDVEALSVGSVNTIMQHHESNVFEYLIAYIKGHYDAEGIRYYTIDQPNVSSYWVNFFKHCPTQNVAHVLLGQHSYEADHAWWNPFGKDDWPEFGPEQVEDVPIATTNSMQPLAEPTGLNKVIIYIKNGPHHACFVNQNHYFQLTGKRSQKMQTRINVRRYTL